MKEKKNLSLQNLKFKVGQRNQEILFPRRLTDMIADDHPVRVIDDLIDSYNVDSILATYREGGAAIYHPRVLLKLLVYGYMDGHTSSRSLEIQCQENIVYMWLLGNLQPDHSTIATFRSGKLRSAVEDLFGEIVKNLYKRKLITLKEQVIDGTKIEASANRYTYNWRKNAERHGDNARTFVLSILEEVSSSIAEEELHLQELTEELTSSSNQEKSKKKERSTVK